MATVWMRSKLQKLKPRVEQRFAVQTLQEHGNGGDKFKAVRQPEPPKDRTPIAYDPAMVRRVAPVEVKAKRHVMGGDWRGPIKALDLWVDAGSVLIKKRA